MVEFEQIFSEKERIKIKNDNIKAITQAFQDLPAEQLELHVKIIEEAATYATNLTEINKIIERDGLVDFYQNGENQWGTKKSVAAEMKPKYTATYQSLIKQLTELLPKEDDGENDPAKECFEFINGRETR